MAKLVWVIFATIVGGVIGHFLDHVWIGSIVGFVFGVITILPGGLDIGDDIMDSVSDFGGFDGD